MISISKKYLWECIQNKYCITFVHKKILFNKSLQAVKHIHKKSWLCILKIAPNVYNENNLHW